MVKPVDSKSAHRPLSRASEGMVLKLEAKVVQSGHVSSVIQIGPLQVRIGNAALREASGKADL
jgi:hypothetical protein